ncbi:sugar ABC transporter permease [Catenulispora pinistramenti]|uniref:sugar ABC transporter permease n=1 Tax=Catenulispora pinistramenti TaxID=2705254 RepID=UPI001E5BE7F0|nr:ABC transporter permease [Catenulispora pinistramenti]
MSTQPATENKPSPVQDAVPPAKAATTLLGYGRERVERARGGEMGSLPAVAGLIVLVVFFWIVQPGFLSLYNIANLVTQAAPIIILAMGLVFVLLLGEIDLSAGTASGVCAALMAVMIVRHNMAWYFAVLLAVITGAVLGFLIGWLRAKARIPSFVVTLAAFLSFQGIVLMQVGKAGSVSLPDQAAKPIITLEGYNNNLMPLWLGWVMLAVVAGGYALVKLRIAVSRRSAGLESEPTLVTVAKTVAMVILGAIFVYVLGENRAIQQNAFFNNLKIEGIPWVVLLLIVLTVGLTFILSRTRYGRHVYAVGGNDEASRRAGIRVDRIRISVFVVCSLLAAVAGIVQASQLESVASNFGAGNTLLLAVGAAVIGGTSLFGGRGRIMDAVWGGLVVAVIQNGMGDLIKGANSQAWQWIVTGLVLLLAAGFDAASRRVGGADSR